MLVFHSIYNIELHNYFCLDGNKFKWWLYSKMSGIAAKNVNQTPY